MKTFEELVLDERNRQDQKWGVQRHNFPLWATILTEECGEVAKASLEYYFVNSPLKNKLWLDNLEEELVQVAAVSRAIWEHIQEIKENQ